MGRLNIRNFMPGAAGSASPPAPAPINLAALEHKLFKSFEECGKGWFWAVDAQNHIIYISPTFAALFASTPDVLLGENFLDFFLSTGVEANPRHRLSFVLNRRSNFDCVTKQTECDGVRHWWEISGRVQTDRSGEFQGYLGFATDVTERLESSQSASQLALVDALTGLPNRLAMQQQLDEIAAQIRAPGRTYTIVLLDLDRFKAVNDSLGHPAGDALLQQVAHRLRRIIGERGKVFRLGGDEFQLMLPGLDDRASLGLLMDDIIASLSQPYTIEGSRCAIGASAGLAVGPADGRSGEDLMRNADLALYAAKDAGRGCHRFFEPGLLKLAADRRMLEEDLRDAIAKGEISLYYQPVVNLRTGDVTCVEALMRWHHPTQGLVSPAVFIPIAEDADLIEMLGEWALRKACEQAAAWPTAIRVAVNVSAIQFANPALPGKVVSALANAELPPDRLELEITEGVFLGESTDTDEMFAALKRIGVRLSLDDFGTGYSSLGYLKTAPFDKIKIDQSFVRGATLPGSRNGAIIAAIVALAEALDMETTAEGIESFDQLDLIRDLGVSHVQGYVYSKPINNDDLTSQLEAGQWTISPSGPARHRPPRRTMYRRVGVIVGSYYHPVLLRNVSETGAYIEGLFDVPIGAQLIVDFGTGLLAVAEVRRADPRGHGITFFNPLEDDGAGGLRPQNRIAPYLLATCGLSDLSLGDESALWDPTESVGFEALLDKLEMKITRAIHSADGDGDGDGGSGDGTSGNMAHHKVLAKFAAINPLQRLSLLTVGNANSRRLSNEEWDRLRTAVEESGNAQLKFVIALVVVTGARFQELLTARRGDIDVEARLWRIPASADGEAREIRLSAAALEIIADMPQVAESDHLVVNPRTGKPFKSIFTSWDAARKKAGLASLSIHDLRNSMQKVW